MKELKFDLIKELKLDGISEKDKKEILDKYSKSLETKILGRIISELPQEKLKELDALISSGKSEEANQYLIDNVQNIDNLAMEEFEDFKGIVLSANKVILEDIENLKKEINQEDSKK